MKKFVIAMIAFAAAFAGVAFTTHSKVNHSAKSPASTYYYLYTLNTVAGENTAANYSFISPQPGDPGDVPGCSGTAIPCVIQATGNMSHPDASQVTTSNLPSVTRTKKATQ